MGRRIAVLGEMLELGDQAAVEHQDLGRYAAQAGVDLLVAVGGELARNMAVAAAAAGVPEVVMVGDNMTAAAYLHPLLREGDVVLVKGSRSGMHWKTAQSLAGQPVSEWGDWN